MRFLSFFCSATCVIASCANVLAGAEAKDAGYPVAAPHLEAKPLGFTADSQPAHDFLKFAAVENQNLYATLESFVCREQIERFRGRTGSGGGHHVDTITARVSIENNTEQYSELRQKSQPLRDFSSLDGAWSEGEFGTLLKQTEQLLGTQQASFEGEERDAIGFVAIYSFAVEASESPWDLTVGGIHYNIPFRTRVWISESTGQIAKIERASFDIPPGLGIADLDWSVALNSVDFNGKKWLLPDTAGYQVIYRDRGRREWNTMKFSDYHRYSVEAAVHFN